MSKDLIMDIKYVIYMHSYDIITSTHCAGELAKTLCKYVVDWTIVKMKTISTKLLPFLSIVIQQCLLLLFLSQLLILSLWFNLISQTFITIYATFPFISCLL